MKNEILKELQAKMRSFAGREVKVNGAMWWMQDANDQMEDGDDGDLDFDEMERKEYVPYLEFFSGFECESFIETENVPDEVGEAFIKELS
jgi:hypothetical protein